MWVCNSLIVPRAYLALRFKSHSDATLVGVTTWIIANLQKNFSAKIYLLSNSRKFLLQINLLSVIL